MSYGGSFNELPTPADGLRLIQESGHCGRHPPRSSLRLECSGHCLSQPEGWPCEDSCLCSLALQPAAGLNPTRGNCATSRLRSSSVPRYFHPSRRLNTQRTIRSHEPVSVFITFECSHRFLFAQELVSSRKSRRSDNDLCLPVRLNVPQPVCRTAKAAHYHNLRAGCSILDDFENRLVAEAGAASYVGKKYKALAQQRCQSPSVNVHRSVQKGPQCSISWGMAHITILTKALRRTTPTKTCMPLCLSLSTQPIDPQAEIPHPTYNFCLRIASLAVYL
jgi:hypothetical protein